MKTWVRPGLHNIYGPRASHESFTKLQKMRQNPDFG